MRPARIAGITCYPVKSCAGVPLDEAHVDAMGVAHDRRFALADAAGRLLTQRECPLLATLRPRLAAHTLQLDLGGLAQVSVPLEAAGRALATPGALREYLGRPVRLVALGRSAARSFADAQPVLVVSTVALARLNALLERPVGPERFRANVLLDTETEGWTSLDAGETRLERVEDCERCEVITIDQASGTRREAAPLRALHERFAGCF
ncbi:MAG TPA: MOSC N-terminal beta barrel domain-containing protein, partial [Burkholderiales bacterium]|nr:MOSC N-terminal beta barrel domain-containing protein [Burkholderiales bacterium]